MSFRLLEGKACKPELFAKKRDGYPGRRGGFDIIGKEGKTIELEGE